jgi:hypothetical protein
MLVAGSIHIAVGRVPAVPTAMVSPSKASETVSQAQSAKPPVSQSANQNISSSLLWSVNEPAERNHLTTADYLAMRNDLVTGNHATAQQSYPQMQNDLQVYQTAASAVAGVLNQLA